MSDRRAQQLLDGTTIRLFDVSCQAPVSAPAEEEHTVTTQVILPLRGCFEVHRGRHATVADPTTVVLFRAGEDVRVGHPSHGGDDCLVFALPPPTAEDVLGPADIEGLVAPRLQLHAHRVRAALRRGAVDPLDAEERALDLVRAIVGGSRGRSSEAGAGRAQHVTVERVRALLASRPAERWRLDWIAREVFVSPAHLARRFRAATGESIAGYLLRLRLSIALDRLADGEENLGALAVDLGFAHHSHFSARFRRVFGVTPSAFRGSLDARRLAQLRTIVTAPDRAAS